MSSRIERLKAIGLRAAVALAGAVSLYFLATSTAAQTAVLMFGVNAGTSKPVSVDASGNINVKCLSGCSGGGGTPANPSGSVQFNNGGAFGGSAGFTFSDTGTAVRMTLKGGSAQGAIVPAFEVLTNGGFIILKTDEGNARVQVGGPSNSVNMFVWSSGAPAIIIGGPTDAYVTTRSTGKFAITNGGDTSGTTVDVAWSRAAAGVFLIEDGSGNPRDGRARTFDARQDNITVTSTDGIILENTTAATAGVQQQWSPRVHFQGQYWTGSVTTNADVYQELQAIAGAPALWWTMRVGGGGAQKVLGIGNGSGTIFPILIPTASINANCSVTAAMVHQSARGGCFEFADSQPIVIGSANPANGYLKVLNNGTTAGNAYTIRNSGDTTNYLTINNGVPGAGLQISTNQATQPTCATNCGTSPVIAGADTFGTVTMGATGTPASGWVLTFNGTWPAAPSCIVISALTSMASGKAPIAVQTTTTTMTVTTNGVAPANSDKYAYHCGGVQ